MAIEWSSNLSTGVEWQDKHHRELFNRVSALLDAMSVGMGKEEVERLFKFLDSYFVVHFEAEKEAMLKYGYPRTAEHIDEHRGFMDDVSMLKKEFHGGSSAGLVIKMQRRVVDWLINHIGGSDKDLGCFLMKAEARSNRA